MIDAGRLLHLPAGVLSRRRVVPGLAVVGVSAALVLAPVWLPTESRLDLARQALYVATLAATWSFIAGVAGQMTFAHITIAGIAAYAGAIWGRDTASTLGVFSGVWGQMVVGIAFAVVVGTGLGLLLLRFRGTYLALFTLAFAELVRIIVIAERDLTGGWLSLAAPQFGVGSTVSYFVVLAVLVSAIVAIYVALRSRFGLFLRAMREDADASSAMAVDTVRLKLGVFVATSFLVGLAGTVYYHTTSRLTPEMFDLLNMGLIVVYAVLGGLESPVSAAIGAVVLVFLLDALRVVDIGPLHLEPGILRYALFGAVLVVVLSVRPNGLISPLVSWVSRGGSRRAPPIASRTAGATPAAAASADQLTGGTESHREVNLEARGISMRFGGVAALEDVSLVLNRPQIVGLIGPNGAGKTTLVNVLSGYYTPAGGEIVLNGERIDGLPPHEVVRRGVGRTFQISRLFRRMSVKDNLLVPELALGTARSRRETEGRADAALAFVGMSHLAGEEAGNLSGGQQKLLELARLLMLDTSILLLDEPFAGVHPTLRRSISDLLHHVKASGRCVVLIEHDLSAVFELCDRLIVLDAGRLVADGEPDSVRRDPRVIRAYIGSDDTSGGERAPIASSDVGQ